MSIWPKQQIKPKGYRYIPRYFNASKTQLDNGQTTNSSTFHFKRNQKSIGLVKEWKLLLSLFALILGFISILQSPVFLTLVKRLMSSR